MAETRNIYIIGAGIAGLIAAIELEKAGYSATILEKSHHIGGRLRTDISGNLKLDHGFQVLLTQYPAAKRYLDLKELRLNKFLSGAKIFKNQQSFKIGDPIRNISFLLHSLMASIGSFTDKLRILKLSQKLKRKSIDTIFNSPESSTIEYLQNSGFSNQIIDQFFRPFFSGIFLEPQLLTSSRMFEFVYKMFATGFAAIPEGGIHEIPAQLHRKLSTTQLRLNTQVSKIENSSLVLSNGEVLSFHAVLVATDPGHLMDLPKKQTYQWNTCYNLYFKTKNKAIDEPMIGLIADSDAWLNNFYYPSHFQKIQAGFHVISATVVKSYNGPIQELVEKVKLDLKRHCNISEAELLRVYKIDKALPVVSNLSHVPDQQDIRIRERIYLSGDYLANPSLNGAMESGRKAAECLIQDLKQPL